MVGTVSGLFGQDPEQLRFEEGIKQFRKNPFIKPEKFCWVPEPGEWKTIPPKSLSDAGLEKVGDAYLRAAPLLYSEVRTSWDRVRQSHPKAVWDPFTTKWFEQTQTPQDPKRPTEPIWLKQMREELEKLQQACEDGTLLPPECNRKRQEIIDRYV